MHILISSIFVSHDAAKLDDSRNMIGKILGNITRFTKHVQRELSSLRKENKNLRVELNDHKKKIRKELQQVKESEFVFSFKQRSYL